jgi:hypothetical protein
MIHKKYDGMIKELGSLYPAFSEDKKSIYRRKMKAIEQKFKEALFEYYDVANNPKREKLWELTYEKAHDGGFSEMEIEFGRLVELIKEAN